MDKALEKIIGDLLSSYRNVGAINNIDGSNLPSKGAVAGICRDFLQILFPGFHDQEAIHSDHLARVTAHRISSVADRLKEEICKSLRLGQPDCPESRAQTRLMEFLGDLPNVRRLLRDDVEAAYEGDPAARSYDEIILSYPYIEAISIQRLAHLLYLAEIPLVPRMMTEWSHGLTGIDIHPGARIGSHFFIDHGTGVVIGETSTIGSHVKLYQGVSLVARSFQKDEQGKILKGGKRHPDVGSNVTIYANTTILGGDTIIGSGTTIGANVFLGHSVPENSLVFYEETQLKIVPKHGRPGTISSVMGV